MNFKPLALACAAFVAVAATPAHAAFTGAYDASHWTTSGDGNGTAAISADDALLTLVSADFTPDASPGATTLDYSITLTGATTITFNWRYASDDIDSSSDPFGYAINGVSTPLSQDNQAGFIEQDGAVTVFLHEGDTFSFQSSSTDSIFGSSTATVTDFSAVGAVPEPAPVVMLLAGVGMLAGASRRRHGRIPE
jgi:hypothetical protein